MGRGEAGKHLIRYIGPGNARRASLLGPMAFLWRTTERHSVAYAVEASSQWPIRLYSTLRPPTLLGYSRYRIAAIIHGPSRTVNARHKAAKISVVSALVFRPRSRARMSCRKTRWISGSSTGRSRRNRVEKWYRKVTEVRLGPIVLREGEELVLRGVDVQGGGDDRHGRKV